MILMAVGIILSFTMRPDRTLETDEEKKDAADARKFV
jgi:hypothetical protein